MKKILFTLIYLQSIVAFGQAPVTEWVKKYGSSGVEDKGRAACVDANGNIYITGMVGGSATFGTYNSSSVGSIADVFLAKVSAAGNVLWVRRYGGSGSGYSVGYAVAVDTDNNIYITGQFSTSVITFGGTTLNRVGDQSTFVTKINPNGSVIWAKGSGGNSYYTAGAGIAVDLNNNVYVNGRYNAISYSLAGITVSEIGGAINGDCFLIKMDQNGNGLWGLSYGDNQADPNDYPGGIDVDSDGNVFVSGLAYGNSIKVGTHTLTNPDSYATYFFKADPSGNVQWLNKMRMAQPQTNASVPSAQVVATDLSGNIYFGGHFESTTIAGAHSLTSAGGTDGFVVKSDGNGNVLWAKRFGSVQNDWVYSIVTDNSGHLYLTAIFGTTTTIAPGITVNGEYVIKLDSNGDVIWAKKIQITENCLAKNMHQNVYTIGTLEGTKSFDSFSLTSSGTRDIILLKLDNDCPPATHSISETACNSFTWTDGNGETYTSSTSVSHTFIGGAANGCDSIVTLNLTINQPTSSSVTVTQCEEYMWALNNQTYTSSGAYTHIIPNANNCDSTITLNLTINNVDNTVSVSGITLIANQAGASYQWVDCDNGNASIPGETEQSFEPTSNGNYAVEVTANGCTETSGCVVVNSVGIESLEQNGWNVYPNPGNGLFTIKGTNLNNSVISVMNTLGQVISAKPVVFNETIIIDLTNEPTGVYLLIIDNRTEKLIKQ